MYQNEHIHTLTKTVSHDTCIHLNPTCKTIYLTIHHLLTSYTFVTLPDYSIHIVCTKVCMRDKHFLINTKDKTSVLCIFYVHIEWKWLEQRMNQCNALSTKYLTFYFYINILYLNNYNKIADFRKEFITLFFTYK